MNHNELNSVDLSVILPVYNEVQILPELYARLKAVLDETGRSYEIIFVNDRSTDGSEQVLKELAQDDPTVVLVTFRKNFGQTAALVAGFDYARGEIIIIL